MGDAIKRTQVQLTVQPSAAIKMLSLLRHKGWPNGGLFLRFTAPTSGLPLIHTALNDPKSHLCEKCSNGCRTILLTDGAQFTTNI